MILIILLSWGKVRDHVQVTQSIILSLMKGYHLVFMPLSPTSTKYRFLTPIQKSLTLLEWKAAIWEEIHALEENGTWEISNLTIKKHPMGCKWIFIAKHKANVSANKFKAPLVAKGSLGLMELITRRHLAP